MDSKALSVISDSSFLGVAESEGLKSDCRILKCPSRTYLFLGRSKEFLGTELKL